MRHMWRCLAVLTALALLPATAAAQQDDYELELPQESTYMDLDEGWKERRFRVGGFSGQMTGGTPLGSIENVFFRSSYDMDTDSMWGLRVGFVFAPRFEVEIEYGRSSPGVNVILTDLAGQGRTEFSFADLHLSYLMGVVSCALLERSRRIVPVLSLGYGTVSMTSTASEIADSRQMGLVFGAGLHIRVIDNFGVRADVRGLRTGFGPKQQDGQLPSIFLGDFNASNLYWTAGFEFRF